MLRIPPSLARRFASIRLASLAFSIPLAVVLVVPLTLTGCDGNDTEKRDADVTPSDGNETSAVADAIKFEVELEETSVPLGAPLPFRVRLSNEGERPAKVNVPRIGRHSLSFRVVKGTRISVIERFNADIDWNSPRFDLLWKAGTVKTLQPGESFEQTVETTALETGKFTFTPQYQLQGAPLMTAAPISVIVLPTEDGKTRIGAVISSSEGDMTVLLRPDLAYNTVESFVSLARQGFFDGLTFHRVIKTFMAQGGCPDANGRGSPGYFLPHEGHTKLLHNRGVLSMARTGNPSTAGSQFFLMFGRRPNLDKGFNRGHGYTTFGQVVDGDDTLTRLESFGAPPSAPPHQQVPSKKLTIEKIAVTLLD